MFIYIYHKPGESPGENRPSNRIAVVLVELKRDVSCHDETNRNAPSVTSKRTEICGASETWGKKTKTQRAARQFPLRSTCSSFGIRTGIFPLRVQHPFTRWTTHRQTGTHPLRLFYSATASMAQEQSQELPVEQQPSNGTGGDTEVKLSAACYSLINHLPAAAHHIQLKIKVRAYGLQRTHL